MFPRALQSLLVTACLLAPAAVSAGPFRLSGYDSLAQGQAGVQEAYASGPGAMYSNPALLVDVAEGFHFSFFLFQPLLSAELMDRPANADIPVTFYDSDVGLEGSNLDRPLPTVELRNARADNQPRHSFTYLGLGLTHSLGIENFRLGLGVLVPTDGLAAVRANYPDEREQYFSNTVHFVRYGEWSQVLSLLLGLSYRPWPWLSFGASVEGALAIGAALDMYIPEATVQDYALVNTAFDATPTARGVVGINGHPLPWLSVSLVWRDRRYTKIDADAMLNLWNYHEAGTSEPKRVEQRHLLALDFEPMEVALAVGAQLSDFRLQASLTWNHWADYLDAHHKRAQETAAYTPGDTDAPVVDGSAFAFSDTFSLGLGGSWQYLEDLSLTAGFSWRPTPVPAQIGRTNYLDGDLFGASLGHRADLRLWGRVLRLDVGLQFWVMPEQTVYKDPDLIKDEFPDRARTLIGATPMPEAAGLQTNNPGFPGFTFGGYGLGGSVSLCYLF